MGRHRNNHQSKWREESPERVLKEIRASNLSDIEFKIMVIRMLKELSESSKELYGSYKKHNWNYISMKEDTETMSKSQEEMKKTISEMKNTLGRIKMGKMK